MTLQLKPTMGKTIRIELRRTSDRDRDGFDLVEVDGGNNAAPATRQSRTTLNIVEVELYERTR